MTHQRIPLRQFLHALGWPPEAITTPQGWPGSNHSLSLLHHQLPGVESLEFLALESAGIRQLIIVILQGSALPTYGECQACHRDFTPFTDRLLSMVGAFSAEGECALFIDDHRFYLYDIDRREVLIHGDTLVQQKDLLLPLLSHIRDLRGRLAQLPRLPVSISGHRLAEALSLFRYEIGGITEASQTHVERITLQALLMAFLTVRDPRDPRIIRGRDASPRHFFEQLTAAQSPPELADNSLLAARFRDAVTLLHRRHSIALCTFPDEWNQPGGFWAIIQSRPPGWLAARLEVFMLQMPTKYTAEVMEYGLLDEEDHRRSLRFAMNQPAAPSLAIRHEGGVVHEPAVIDVQQTGIGWGLQMLTFALDHFEAERQRQLRHVRRYQHVGSTRDLFNSGSPGTNDAGLVEDPVMIVLNDAIKWRGIADPIRHMRAALLIIATVQEWLWDPAHPARARRHVSYAAIERILGPMPPA